MKHNDHGSLPIAMQVLSRQLPIGEEDTFLVLKSSETCTIAGADRWPDASGCCQVFNQRKSGCRDMSMYRSGFSLDANLPDAANKLLAG